jgi:cysteinyl-tRNA synthetase
MRLFNTLTRSKEEIQTIEPGVLRMYTCGPTVYRYIHIGNIRAFLVADLIRRAFTAQGYEVKHIKNITDVGHMRQEMLEQGEDKVIAEALAQGKTPYEIADFYTEAFLADESKSNILRAQEFPKATDHIPEMITMVQQLLDRGHAYSAGDNIYFDVSSFPGYGKLSGNVQETLLAGGRVETDPLKQSPADFTLWKAAEPGRDMKWPSPWGEGFPGWHIECSAMSTKYFGDRFDLHTGGVDNIFPHHEGEIAQSEGALGQQVVNYWVHCQHVLAAGQKMAKSAGNAYTMTEIEERGFQSLAYRYLCLTSHYRSRMNFTFTALVAAQKALDRLRRKSILWSRSTNGVEGDAARVEYWRSSFWEAINDDLATPKALATAWQMADDSALSGQQRLGLLLEFDQVFGLDISEWVSEYLEVPTPVNQLAERRVGLRSGSDYSEADGLRVEAGAKGFVIEDGLDSDPVILPIPHGQSEAVTRLAKAVASPKVIPSRLDEPSELDVTVIVNAVGWPDDVWRVVGDSLKHLGSLRAEVIAIDNGTFDGTWEMLDAMAIANDRLRVVHTDHFLGEAPARNIGLKLARGRVIVALDTSVGLDGDLFTPVLRSLEDPEIGMIGTWGLITENFKDFEEVEDGVVDALQAYCCAFRREDLRKVGLMDERFVFYRNLDVDFSFQFREKGFKVVASSALPVSRYVHRVWEELAPDEREKKSKKNWTRFFEKYHHRDDLLVTPGAAGYDHPEEGAGSDHDH